MKKTSIVILVIGLVITFFTGLNFVTKKKITGTGNIEITASQKHSLELPPLLGFAVMAIGAGIYLVGRNSNHFYKT